jgi:hypothetical protein
MFEVLAVWMLEWVCSSIAGHSSNLVPINYFILLACLVFIRYFCSCSLLDSKIVFGQSAFHPKSRKYLWHIFSYENLVFNRIKGSFYVTLHMSDGQHYFPISNNIRRYRFHKCCSLCVVHTPKSWLKYATPIMLWTRK